MSSKEIRLSCFLDLIINYLLYNTTRFVSLDCSTLESVKETNRIVVNMLNGTGPTNCVTKMALQIKNILEQREHEL